MKKRFFTVIAVLSFMGIFVAMPAYAQLTGGTNNTNSSSSDPSVAFKLNNPLKKIDSVNKFLVVVLDSLVFLLTPVIVIMLLWSGFLFVTAQGSADKRSKAKKALLYTLIGAGIILGAKGFALAIEGTISEIGNVGS